MAGRNFRGRFTLPAILLLLVVIADLGLRASGTSRISCQTVLQSDASRPRSGCEVQESRAVLLYLPGVRARAASASAPVIDTWLEFGDVQLVDYSGDRFEPATVAQAVAEIVRGDVEDYETVVIYAESLGCFVAVDALEHLRVNGIHLREPPRVLLGDCPSGPATIKPNSSVTEVFYPGPIADHVADGFAGIWHWVTRLTGTDEPPLWSWSSSSTPSSNFEPGVDVLETQKRQREDSAGFSLAVFADQVRYMRKGMPNVRAMARSRVIYLMVQPEVNGSVVQPQAMDDWSLALQRVGGFLDQVRLDFPSGHVDYGAWPRAWNRVFREQLRTFGE